MSMSLHGPSTRPDRPRRGVRFRLEPLEPRRVLDGGVPGQPNFAYEGHPWTGVVAAWRYYDDKYRDPAKFSVLINWGDGLTSKASVVYDPHQSFPYSIPAGHTYSIWKDGYYDVTATVTDSAPLSGDSTISVHNFAIAVLGAVPSGITVDSFSTCAGEQYHGEVARFTVPYAENIAEPFQARIYWDYGDSPADGQPVTIVRNGDNSFSVIGTHTFSREGTYSIVVAAGSTEGGGINSQTPGTATIKPSPATPEEVFDRAYAFIRKWEGGLANVAGDAGGLTKFGVTQASYNSYRRGLGLKSRSVARITTGEVRDIFENRLFYGTGTANLPPLLAIVQLDTQVNFGNGGYNARKHVKGAQGFLDEVLANAEPGESDLDLARDYVARRIAFRYERVKAVPSQKKFLKGWLRRDNALGLYVNLLEPAFAC